jgi:formyltetrahydrofolate deformylase
VPTATLLAHCLDRPGIIASLTDLVYRNGGNVVDLDEHVERETDFFFVRLVWDLTAFRLDRDTIAAKIAEVSRGFGMHWELSYSDVRQRAAVFASKTPHCLYDLLMTWSLDELGGDIVLVISNHEELRSVAEHFGVRYEHVPFDPERRDDAEAVEERLLRECDVDVVVLARYMQLLSPAFVDRWSGRLVNIHHSFLPAFVGAQAYRQAKERGVKMIGATAHYVTNELDQGPIIEQDVVRVSHRDDVRDYVRKGRSLEAQVLTRAVRLHLERRVLISGNRTVVFD